MRSRAFLTRAREHLARFADDGSRPAGILYAALDLRFGIEARLYEYLAPTLRRMGRDGPTDHEAKVLLRELCRADPRPEHRSILSSWNEPTGNGCRLTYTPVTQELAADHGRIGVLLHFRFFHFSPEWSLPRRTHGRRTLLDWHTYLEGVAGRLGGACAGTRLTDATFTRYVEDVLPQGAPGDA